MKDKHDTRTQNLLVTKNAQHQRDFKERMKAEGKKQKQLWIDVDSFERGRMDGKKAFYDGAMLIDYLNEIVIEQHYCVLSYVAGFESEMKK